MYIALPQAVRALLDSLENAGFSAFVVGGCVRDSLVGRPVHDWDLCTSAMPDEVMACFRNHTVLPTGIAHGTVTVLMAGIPYEITTFRTDGAYTDHRRPDSVAYVEDVQADLARRDFTINAIAYHPARGIVDPFGGREDLDRGIIRCVGEPALRFDEDALRILRALRFAAACGYAIDAPTAEAMETQRGLLAHVARERVRVEVEKLLCAPGYAAVMLAHPRVLCAAVPALLPLAGDPPAWQSALDRVARASGDDPPARWAALLWQMGVGQADALLAALRCDNRTRRRVAALLAARELPLDALPTDAQLRWGLHALGPQGLRELLWLRLPSHQRPDALAALEALLARHPCYRLGDLAVTGADLLALGMAPGAAVGHMLQRLLAAVIQGEIDNKKDALVALALANLSECVTI